MNHLPLPVIFAGGLGSRLGPLAEGLPKPMVPVGGRPFLEYLVRQLAGQGFPEMLLLVGFRAEMIESHFGDGSNFGLRIHYHREPKPMGTGGALKLAEPILPERMLVLYGDLYRDFDYAGFCVRHDQALAVYPYVDGLTTIASPNVGIDTLGLMVTKYVKGVAKSGMTHVDAGFGVFRREVVALLPEGISSFEACVYPVLAASGRLEAEQVDRSFFDIGNPTDLARTRAGFPAQ